MEGRWANGLRDAFEQQRVRTRERRRTVEGD